MAIRKDALNSTRESQIKEYLDRVEVAVDFAIESAVVHQTPIHAMAYIPPGIKDIIVPAMVKKFEEAGWEVKVDSTFNDVRFTLV